VSEANAYRRANGGLIDELDGVRLRVRLSTKENGRQSHPSLTLPGTARKEGNGRREMDAGSSCPAAGLGASSGEPIFGLRNMRAYRDEKER